MGEGGVCVSVCVGEGWWWWCGLNVVRACLSIHAHACNEEKWTSASALVPSAGTDPAGKSPKPFPSEEQVPGVPESKSFTQPQVEEKDCEARRPDSPLLRRKGGAIFSIASALSGPGPDC